MGVHMENISTEKLKEKGDHTLTKPFQSEWREDNRARVARGSEGRKYPWEQKN